ncbi:MAG TPA: c-type cytochrome [Oleiagrimonas sp.]|nr:c-type cytochrome [Oleiagrimonas sp.]
MSNSDKQFVRQFSQVIGFLAVFAACLLAGASYIYSQQPDMQADAVAKTTANRLAPIANVYAGDTGRAAMAAAKAAAAKAAASKVAYGGTTDGKTIFHKLCTTCHTNPATGAPQLGDAADWAPRIAEGIPTLIKHAINGYTGPDGHVMPPKGGNPALTKEQITATVKWIVSQSK